MEVGERNNGGIEKRFQGERLGMEQMEVMVEEERMGSRCDRDEEGDQLRKVSMVVAGGGAGARAEDSGLGFENFRFGFGLESLSSLLPLLSGSLGSFVGHGHSRCGWLQQ